MEFFERAHVTRKNTPKKENNSDDTVKKQLKQMLNAYKKGNNREIKSYCDTENKYDVDDVKSLSDYSDLSFHNVAHTNQESLSSSVSGMAESSSGHNASSSNKQNSSKSDISESNTGDNLKSVTQFEEELNSLSSSYDVSLSDKDFSTTYDKSSILSEGLSDDSDISIPSSLQKSDTDSDVSDDKEFDPDGALASKILENLGKKLATGKKRKLTKENKKSENDITTKEKQKKDPKVLTKKERKNKKKNSHAEFSNTEAFRVLNDSDRVDSYDEVDSTYRNIKTEISEDSFHGHNNFDESLSSNDSSTPYISVLASDMQSQSLSEIIGEYIHPTTRNLPSEKQNVVHSLSTKYAILDEIISEENMEDTSSIIPEIDDELTIADLTLETDTQEADESTLYDNTIQTEDYFENESTTEDIEPKPHAIKAYNGRNNYILVMKHPAMIYIHGKVKIKALGGSVEVFGYTLEDESVDVFAPYCYYAHSLKTVSNPSAFHGLFSRLSSAGLTASEAEEIISMVAEHDAVISLSKLNSSKIDFVDNNFTTTELFTKRSDQTPKFLKKAAENLGCSVYLELPKRVFEEKNSWDQIVSFGMNDQSRGIICGGKNTGKSTLLRYYVNRLLTNGPVLVIDLDPGQAEFTLSGNISACVVDSPLVGPNFTHLRQPEKSLNIGMINTMDNPFRYISAVRELVTYCHSNEAFQSMPWIVNTMGMCNHMGLKFITYIILQVQPTFVYQTDSKSVKNRFEYELRPETIKNLYEDYKRDNMFSKIADPYNLEYAFVMELNDGSSSPQKGNNFALSPKDERYLNMLAYFGELLNIHGKTILDIVPYEVNMRDLSIGVNVKIPEEALTKVINGKIIALCQLTAADKGRMFTLADNALSSHGYGLIRGIDFEKGLLYILTPVPIDELNSVNALVYADWMPELLGQEKELPSGTMIPYRTATMFQQRRLMFPPRRRFNPIQLLKVARNS